MNSLPYSTGLNRNRIVEWSQQWENVPSEQNPRGQLEAAFRYYGTVVDALCKDNLQFVHGIIKSRSNPSLDYRIHCHLSSFDEGNGRILPSGFGDDDYTTYKGTIRCRKDSLSIPSLVECPIFLFDGVMCVQLFDKTPSTETWLVL